MKTIGSNMLLAIDIGNSTIGIGLYIDATNPESLLIRKVALKPAATAATIKRAFTELLSAASASASSPVSKQRKVGVIIASVVPSVTKRIIKALPVACLKPLMLDHKTSGLRFNVPHPETIGADRLANAVAAWGINQRPTAVIDFGTATTITVIGTDMTFLGGTIMPGIDTMLKSLAVRTAQLPRLYADAPESALGRDTAAAIRSGVVIGTAGAVMHIIETLEDESGLSLPIVVTGGRAALISPFIEHAHTLATTLVFDGMRSAHLAKKRTRKLLV
jgi:type III pantothenate kinase